MTKSQVSGSRQLSPPFVVRISNHERGTPARYVQAEVHRLKSFPCT